MTPARRAAGSFVSVFASSMSATVPIPGLLGDEEGQAPLALGLGLGLGIGLGIGIGLGLGLGLANPNPNPNQLTLTS